MKDADTRRRKPAAPEEPAEQLTRGRLIVALDALLKTGSATLAAKKLGLKTSAVSRMLAQLREQLNDPIFTRSGRGLVPTPFAEEIRPMVASAADGIEAVFERNRVDRPRDAPFDSIWNRPTVAEAPELRVRPAYLMEGEPSAHDIERKLARMAEANTPQEQLAQALGAISTSTGRRRPLSTDEAREAMAIILGGEADPVQIGAFMGILQFRNTTAGELAGFVQAVRGHAERRFPAGAIEADLDWPCYVSPNQQNPPWFLHAAKLAAQAGHRVLLHGASGAGDRSGRLEVAARALDIPVCLKAEEVSRALDAHNIAFLPLAAYAPQVYRLLGLHRLTGHRSPVRDALHLADPGRAQASLFGVSQSSNRELHRDAAQMLGLEDVAILGNVRDVAQFAPFRSTVIYRLVGGKPLETKVRSIAEPPVQKRARTTTLEYWGGIWTGAAVEERVEKIVTATTALALMTLARDSDARFGDHLTEAERLWKERRGRRG